MSELGTLTAELALPILITVGGKILLLCNTVTAYSANLQQLMWIEMQKWW